MMDMKDSDELESDVIARYISDTIKVNLISEKKGTFLKHTEYEITSEKFGSKVERRYNDFVQLHSQIVTKYAARLIPRLPPKQLMLDSFLEERRCGLERWLRMMSHHRLLANDEMFKIFLTDTSPDHQGLLQESFFKHPDEFAQVSADFKQSHYEIEQLVTQRELMRIILNHVVKLKRLMEQQSKREINQSKDFMEMSQVLNSIMRDTNDESFKDFTDNFQEISKESEKISLNQQRAVFERLTMLIEILTGHSDMCERVEKSITIDHQALSKTLNINTQKIRSVIRRSSVDDIKAMNEKQQNELHTLHKRNAFNINCVINETKFAQKYLKLLPSILLQFANEESKGFKNISEIFSKIIQVEIDKLS